MSIYLLTMPDGAFGSAGQSWAKLDIDKIKENLKFKILISDISEIGNIEFNDDDTLIYTSSENEAVRIYLKNSLYYIKDKVNIIPSYELLMAHEDKGFQEILKQEKKIGNLKGEYILDIPNRKIIFPKVLKTSQGAGSSGVFLVKNTSELKGIEKKFFKLDLKSKTIALQRKIKLTSHEYNIYQYRKKKFNLFVEQEFIAELQHDFKVLVFGDRYYVLKRSVRKNDFRASGSGNFEFTTPPIEVLNFAREISLILDNPYFSLDIAQSSNGCHLIEFQATNFGPYTLLNAPNRYIFDDTNWKVEKNCKDLELNYAYALNYYIGKKHG